MDGEDGAVAAEIDELCGVGGDRGSGDRDLNQALHNVAFTRICCQPFTGCTTGPTASSP